MKALFCLLLLSSTAFAQSPAEVLAKLGAKTREQAGVIIEATVDAKQFTEADYEALGTCTTLKKLVLDGKTLNDSTLPLLAGLKGLEELSTNGSDLTDAGCKHFAAFQNLRSLALWHPSFGSETFTGAGVAELKALPKLTRFTFAGASAGDAFMEALGMLTQVESFSTWHTAQTTAGNAAYAKFTKLKSLRIGQRLPPWGKDIPPSFDASTVKLLSQHPALEEIDMMEAVFTAEDLVPLKNLKTLKRLKLHTLDISESDVAKLREAMPGVKIAFQPITAEEREGTLKKKLRLLK